MGLGASCGGRGLLPLRRWLSLGPGCLGLELGGGCETYLGSFLASLLSGRGFCDRTVVHALCGLSQGRMESGGSLSCS